MLKARTNIMLGISLLGVAAACTYRQTTTPESKPELSKSEVSARAPRIGLTDTVYQQIHVGLRLLNAEPVALVNESSLRELFLENPDAMPEAKSLAVRKTTEEVPTATLTMWSIAQYEVAGGILDRYIASRLAQVPDILDPRFLRPIINMKRVEELVRDLDGLLVAGGQDMNTVFSGLKPVSSNSDADLEGATYARTRDIIELAFISEARRQGKPILGVCRGSQILGRALGAKLIQDLPTAHPELGSRHSQATEMEKSTGHDVVIDAESKLARLMGLTQKPATDGKYVVNVNSYHHQAVTAPGAALEVGARDQFALQGSEQGIIEGFTVRGDKFTVGVQWHPERALAETNDIPGSRILDPQKLFPKTRPHDRALIENFVRCARKTSDCL